VSVVIGIRCSDGIVLGSDSAASLMSQGMVTAQQRSMKKVAANGRVLSGVTGHTGLAQRIRAELENHLNSGSWTGERQSVVTQMRRHLWINILDQEMRAAKASFKTIGHPSCIDSARTETLVATVIEGRPELVHLNETCAPTLVQDDIPFCSIGVGQPTADPFLAFARRILWPGALPNIGTAIFSVAWALMHVIHANPNGIGDPVQLGVLERLADNWVARELPASEIQEHTNSVLEAEQGLQEWFSRKDSARSVVPPPR
jgi:hypothetical protein